MPKIISTVSAAILILGVTGCSVGNGSGAGPIVLTITSNAIIGGMNSAEVKWITNWVIPTFTKAMSKQGKKISVKFLPQGIADTNYNTKLALDLKARQGADVFSLDGMQVGAFADAQYIKPLDQVVPQSKSWNGWSQIPQSTQYSIAYKGKRYGIPVGAGGRVLYYNKTLFAKAGLSTNWQPKSWNDVLTAARALKKVSGVTPIQLNAGTAMGEATTMQGLLPILSGTGEQVYQNGKWVGATQGLKDALALYKTIYVDDKLGDPVLQQETNGRDNSFTAFSQSKIGILLESDYLWRSVINPNGGTAPMKNRDTVVGYTKIPARQPGSGVNGASFISYDGVGGRMINPNTKNPAMAWQLLSFMNSKEAWLAYVGGTPRITPRTDVNNQVLKSDAMLSYIANSIMPLNLYRPANSQYTQVSSALQQATLDVVTGSSVSGAANTYQSAVAKIVGTNNISTK